MAFLHVSTTSAVGLSPPPGARQTDDLYELVSGRQGRSLITTSNRAPIDWYPLFPNPVVAELPLDRLNQRRPPGHHERLLPTQGPYRQVADHLAGGEKVSKDPCRVV